MEAKLDLIALLLAGMFVLSTQFQTGLRRSPNGKIYRLDDEIPHNRVVRENLPKPPTSGKIHLDDEIPHDRVAIDKRERRPSGGYGGKIYLDNEIPHDRVAKDKRERRPSWGYGGGGKIYLGNKNFKTIAKDIRNQDTHA